LLIKWISALESSQDKLIIFLVPRVALVEQQANYLSDNTPLRISKLFGALDIELSDRMRWRRRLEQCDVLVMTRVYFVVSLASLTLRCADEQHKYW
jgi:endoribonuclease Dicer